MALPKRWEPYCPVGTRIEGTRFISFKVPLNKNLCNKLPEDKRFSPSQLVEVIEEQGQSLAMVIDLTNTNRYYNKQDIESHGIQYEKVYTEGHKVPRDGVVKRFYSAVDRILQETDGEDSLIGVHCTHGVNRTGYLICRYMVEKMSVDPEKAIAAFEEARGHPIERDNYLKDLKMRKNGGPGLNEDSPDERDYNGYNQRSYDQRFRPHSSDNYNGDRPGFKDDCAAGRMASSGYWDFRQNYRTDRYNSVEQYEGPQYWHDDYYCSDDYYLPQPAWSHRGRNSQRSRQLNSTGPPHSSRWHPYSLDRRNNRNQRGQSDR